MNLAFIGVLGCGGLLLAAFLLLRRYRRYRAAVALANQTELIFDELAAELALLDSETLTSLGLEDLQDIFKRLSTERAYVAGLKKQALLMLLIRAAKSSDAQKEKLRLQGINLDLLLGKLQALVHVDFAELDAKSIPSVNWAKAFTQKALRLETNPNAPANVFQAIAEALLCAVFALQMNVAGAIQAMMIAQMTPGQQKRLESVQGLAKSILSRRLTAEPQPELLREPPQQTPWRDRGNSR